MIITASVAQDDTEAGEDEAIDELDTQDKSNAAAGWLIFVGFWGMVLEISVIVIRFLNWGCITANHLIFTVAVS